MRRTRIDFEVATKADAYWIAVDSEDVPLNNGRGSAIVSQTAEKHILYWWFVGREKTALSIVGTVAGKKVVEVKESKVPEGDQTGGGLKRFKLG